MRSRVNRGNGCHLRHGKAAGRQSDAHHADHVKEERLFTSHSVPKVETLDPGDHFDRRHDCVDDGKDAAHETEDDGDGDAENGEQPETEGHEVRVP